MQPPGRGEVRELVDPCGSRFELKYEQWRHIVEDPAHPYMEFNFAALVEGVCNPDFVVASRRMPNRILYHKAITQKAILDGIVVPFRGFIVVVVDKNQGLVVTAYMPDQRKRGPIVWQK